MYSVEWPRGEPRSSKWDDKHAIALILAGSNRYSATLREVGGLPIYRQMPRNEGSRNFVAGTKVLSSPVLVQGVQRRTTRTRRQCMGRKRGHNIPLDCFLA